MRTPGFGYLSSLILCAIAAGRGLAFAATPGAQMAPPEPPPAFRGPERLEKPFDLGLSDNPLRTLLSSPDAWCPAGDDFQRWLKLRSPGAKAAFNPDARTALGGPTITWNNGVVVMEDDGSLLLNDRRPDLEGRTIEFTPAGDNYTAQTLPFAYDSNVGTQVLSDAYAYAEVVVDLAETAFPFGGLSRTRLWVTSNFVAAFTDPSPPVAAQLAIGDLIADRTPRVAPLQQGSSLNGWNAFVREATDRVVITWRATDGGERDVDVQQSLFEDGRIVMTWKKLRGMHHGSVAIVDGDGAWWNDRELGGTVSHPAGDVTVPAPDGPATDIVGVRGFQVGGSEILQIELDLVSPLPPATDGALQYVFEIRDEPGGEVLKAIWLEWEDGDWNWSDAPAETTLTGFRFNLNQSSLNLTDDDIQVRAWTAASWSWQQTVDADIAWPLAPPTPLMRDFSAIGAEPLRGPLAEAFTLPALDVYAVYNAFMAQFGSPEIDGLAVFQNLYTDIIFYAGAYSTVGNAGADGIGAGSSTAPHSPALLHMNAIRYGWAASDAGAVTVLNHEFGHHWLYFYSIDEGGTIGKPCGDGHPAAWTHTPAATPVYNPFDASCMGGSNWTDNGDGTYLSAPEFASYGYSWHELYLMGLAAPSEVTDWFYLRDSVPELPSAYWPAPSLTVTATRVDVTLQQIVDAIGPRVPDSTTSQKSFVVPMVLVVRPGEWVQGDVDETHRLCELWRPQFNVSTLGRGTVTCDQDPTVTIRAASIGLYERSASRFYLRNENSGGAADSSFGFGPGNQSWIPLAGDWDGDGEDSAALYSPSTGRFYLRNQHAGGAADATFQFGPGNGGWIPIAGDWDGDGGDTVGLYNPSTGRFYLRNQHAGGTADATFQFGPGNVGWKPIAGDWDGDGDDTVGLYSPVTGRFYLRNQHAGGAADATFQFGPGNAGWLPIAGDWNGNGTDTVGLYNRAASQFYLRNQHSGGTADLAFMFGPPNASWFPLAGDWNGQ